MFNRKYQVIACIILIAVFIYSGWNLINSNKTKNSNNIEVKQTIEVKESTEEPVLSKNATKTVQTQEKLSKDITDQINRVVRNYYKISAIKKTKNMSAKDQKSNDQVSEFNAGKREVIESYQDIHTYIKTGLNEDTYVVFTTYNIKLFNISTLVPGMSVLTVSKDKKEDFQINDESINEEQKEYISQLSNNKDIKKIIQEVNSNLSKAIKKDKSLKVFVDYMKKVS